MSLSVHVRQQKDQLEKLQALLGRERSLLGEGQVDGDALGLLAIEKTAVLTALADAEQQRRTACTRLGYGNDTADDDEAARTQGCRDLWQQVCDGTREAARINHFNGELINVRLSNNQSLLNELQALTGKNLYGPDGQAHGSHARLSSRA